MTTEVVDLRKSDRFLVVEPLSGTFGPAEVIVLNLSLGGAQFTHPQPLRIGTHGKLHFKRGEAVVAIGATVVWSRLEPTAGGMVYTSGVKLDAADNVYALAINTLMRAGAVRHDTGSLDRKKQRMAEREEARRSQIRNIPISEPPPV